MNEQYPFELAPLPYAYDALEPYIDTRTVTVHHDRHQAGYVKKLNEALREFPEFHSWSLEQLILGCDRLPERIRTDVLRNAGGVWSHEFYFDCMTPKPASACPCGALAKAVDAAFGSCERLRDVMTQSALTRFGAGWAWLACDGDGRLRVLSTGNQDTPLPLGCGRSSASTCGSTPTTSSTSTCGPIISKPGGSSSTGSSPGKITRPAGVEKFPSKTLDFSDFTC